MIDEITSDNILSNFIVDDCCENGICVTFDPTISPEEFVIIKVDDYFNSLKLKKTPASVDCLIFQKCKDGKYGITLVELKSSSSSSDMDFNNILKKFMYIRFYSYCCNISNNEPFKEFVTKISSI